MNATTLQELRAAQALREPQDERLTQVRELLMGDHARDMESRMIALSARLDALEMSMMQSMMHQLDAMAAKIETLAAGADSERRQAFGELARHVEMLSDGIRSISKS